MALQGWDKNYREQLKIQQQQIESLQQQLMIGADPLPPPGEDTRQRPNPNQKPSSPYLPGKSPHKLAHGEGRGPQPLYHDEYNRELPIPPWMQMDPSGKLIEIPWMKEEYLKEHPELRLQISVIPSSKHIRDRLRPFTKGGPYDDKGGSLRGIPDALRIQLLRDAMA